VKHIRVTAIKAALLTTALVLASTVFVIVSRTAHPPPAALQSQIPDLTGPKYLSELHTFSGKIFRVDGKYIFQDEKTRHCYSIKKEAVGARYADKTVLLTGWLDSANQLHIEKIEQVF
jgi:hypothetical protein